MLYFSAVTCWTIQYRLRFEWYWQLCVLNETCSSENTWWQCLTGLPGTAAARNGGKSVYLVWSHHRVAPNLLERGRWWRSELWTSGLTALFLLCDNRSCLISNIYGSSCLCRVITHKSWMHWMKIEPTFQNSESSTGCMWGSFLRVACKVENGGLITQS